MSRAIGMIEFKTTPAGITAADAMVKTSEVEIVEAQTVCPGKYIAIITGDLSAYWRTGTGNCENRRHGNQGTDDRTACRRIKRQHPCKYLW